MNNDYNNQNQNNQGQYNPYGQYPPIDLFGQSQSPFFDPYTQNRAMYYFRR